jgi:hypothetical protein
VEHILQGLKSMPASPMSPWVDAAELHTRDWVRSFGLVRSDRARERFDKTASGELTARLYATTIGEVELCAAADWISWLFMIDDQLDEGAAGRDPNATREFLRPLIELLTGESTEWREQESPLRATLRDIRERLIPTTPSWQARFAGNVIDYLNGCEWEAANRADGRVPGLDEFPSHRRTAGAVWPSFDVLEFVTNDPLPEHVHGHRLFVEACRAAADVICWTDDVMTVDKERARGDVHNLVIVLEHATGSPTDDAMTEAARRIDVRLADFADCTTQLLDSLGEGGADPAARRSTQRYLSGLQNMMRGHLDWGLNTIRYTRVEHTAAGVDPSYLEGLG